MNQKTVLTPQRRQTIVEVTQSLIHHKSLAGEEGEVAKAVIAAMRDLAYDDIRVDALGNVVGILRPPVPASSSPGTLMFDSHMDTVAAAGAWTKNPFGGEVSDHKLWGRGAADMKGPLAASICGAAFAKQDGLLKDTVYVSASVNEEQIEGLALADVLTEYKPSRVVICESTELKLNLGGRGRAEVFLTVHGVPAHASTPQLGVNALKQAAKLILELNTWQPPHHPLLGFGIFEPTEIISNPFPSVSVLPDRCRIRCDRRLLAGETEKDVLNPLRQIINRLHAMDATFNADAIIDTETIHTYTGEMRTMLKFQPAWLVNESDPFARACRNALGEPPIGYYSFCTNAARSAGLLGIPTIGFGPGSEHHAHIADEYIELAQLWDAAAGYYALCAI
ncbi:MAG TPA: YgeY family selenium metabolism-linked hydrolase [Anaerolineae bacterium]|jgi:putative selenium metabolism hydrolase